MSTAQLTTDTSKLELPTTQKSWSVQGTGEPAKVLELADTPVPKPTKGEILVKVQELIDVENRLRAAKTRLAEAEAAWNDDKTKRKREQWERLKNELDMKAHELQLAEDQVGGWGS